MESSGRRILVPVGGANGGAAAPNGGGAYAVLQFVGYAHSPLPSPTAAAASSIMWPVPASPAPSPRTPGSPSPSPLESPKPAPPPLQQQQQVATTFVQADSNSFKEVVQKLTGATDENKLPITMPARYAPRSLPSEPPQNHRLQEVAGGVGGPPPSRHPHPHHHPHPHDVGGPRKAAFKLHERRRNLRSLGINPPPPVFRPGGRGRMSPRAAQPEILSPSMLDLPSLVLSPVTPLAGDPFDSGAAAGISISTSSTEEEKAIKQKGYYLHPSPLSTPRGSEPPQLLPLFPTSPREGQKSSSS